MSPLTKYANTHLGAHRRQGHTRVVIVERFVVHLAHVTAADSVAQGDPYGH